MQDRKAGETFEEVEPLDPTADVPSLVKPEMIVALLWALYLAAAAVPALGAMAADFDEPMAGLALWFATSLGFAIPAGAITGLLAARAERAGTGLRHPQRRLWGGVGVGAILCAHWALMLFWAPLAVLQALTRSYRQEDALLAAVLASVAWLIFGGGVAMATWSARRLRARTWEGVTDARLPGRWPRLDTPVWVAAFYALLAAVPAVFVGFVGADGDVLPALGAWMVAGGLACGAGASLGVRLLRQLPHASGSREGSLRFAELMGALWCAHWALVLCWLLLPFVDDGGDRLATAVGAWMLLVLGTFAWATARAWRRLPVPARSAAG